MRYPGCQKAKAFKLFGQGKRPSEIYDRVTVKKHTLFCYYQLWKREREEESERKRLAEERQQKLEAERRERERKQKEEMSQRIIADSLRAQQRIRLASEYENQKKRVWELEAQMSRANDHNELDRIGSIYSQEYQKFRELTRELYPGYADEKSIERVLHPKQE